MKPLPMLLVLPLILAACSSPPSAGAIETAIAETAAAATWTPSPTSTPTATPKPTATKTSTPTPIPTPTPVPLVLTEDEALALLLSVDDLRTGFAVYPQYTGAIEYESYVTLRGEEIPTAIQESGQFKGWQSSFERRGFMNEYAFLRSWIFEFPSAEAAAKFLQSYTELTTQTSAQKMSFAKFGEESLAQRGTLLTDTGSETEANEVVFRYNNLIAGVVFNMFAGFSDLEEMEEYTRIFDERVKEYAARESN